jgi:EAL domain-containing protein (putative c-di-GMP-specific phosphodiesterase class I)
MITDDTPDEWQEATQRERLGLASALRGAVEGGRLSLRYQPLVRSGDGEVLGFEALLRWSDPDRGEISPGVFVPIAQEAGIMPEIGRWVVRTASQQLADWQRSGVASGLSLHVNFSLAELVDANLPGDVAAEISRAGLMPEQFCFEVTEDDLNAGGDVAALTVERLAAHGFNPVLDDFGLRSSVEILTRHPFVFAKIDRELLVGTDPPPHWHRLLRGIGGLARALGITLIAEGIEGEEDMTRIAALGFAHAQGFAFGRPETAANFGETLAGNRGWGKVGD